MNHFLLRSSLGALALVAAVAAFPSASRAIEFDFTSDHCTGGCGTAPFGSVTLTQNGTTVDVTVHLFDSNQFAQTGAADDQAFKFNATGVVLADITVDAHTPNLIADTGSFSGDGTGLFDFGIECSPLTGCGPGGSKPFSTNIVFHVANATIADLTLPNDKGFTFVADLLSGSTGNTGPVASTTSVPVPGPIVGAGLPGLVMACGGLLALGRRRRQKLA